MSSPRTAEPCAILTDASRTLDSVSRALKDFRAADHQDPEALDRLRATLDETERHLLLFRSALAGWETHDD